MEILTSHDAFQRAVSSALASGRVQPPMSAVEWADEHFYLSAESSGVAGRWKSLPYQIAILNAMGSPDIEKVVVPKAARIGYTKMLMAATGYMCVFRKRSVAIYQPSDGDAKEFVKDEIETAIRDVPIWRSVFPSFGKKASDNTIDRKGFLGSTLWIKGSTSAKNFRRITPDCVFHDEIDANDQDIDGEGTAEALGWKRTQVSSFRKQIIGSTPKEKGSSQVEAAADRCNALMKFHLECPECGDHAPLEFGGKGSDSGFKWDKGKPETVLHFCKECLAGWDNSKLYDASVNGIWVDVSKGYSTRDGLTWRISGEPCPAPKTVAFHVWSAYSPYAPWSEIVSDWVQAQADPLQLKTFVNTTLGETWEAQDGDSVKASQLKSRDLEPMPDDIYLVTLGIDTQADRWELQYLGHTPGGNMVPLAYEIVAGETDRLADWRERLLPYLDRTFKNGGRELTVEATGIDTGGSSTSTAYDFCALYAGKHVLAFKGSSNQNMKQVIPDLPSRKWKKVGLKGWMVGVHAAKDLIFAALARTEGDGRMIFTDQFEHPADYFDQLTSEVRKMRIVRNRRTYIYDKRSPSARNEALDVTVYGKAAAEWLRIHKRVNLEERLLSNDTTDTGFNLL